MKPNHQFYMQLAKQYAILSNAKRKQVGAVLITSKIKENICQQKVMD